MEILFFLLLLRRFDSCIFPPSLDICINSTTYTVHFPAQGQFYSGLEWVLINILLSQYLIDIQVNQNAAQGQFYSGLEWVLINILLSQYLIDIQVNQNAAQGQFYSGLEWVLINILLSQYLIDIQVNQNVAQGYFLAGSYAQIKTHTSLGWKIISPLSIFHVGAFKVPSHEISPVKQVLSGGEGPLRISECDEMPTTIQWWGEPMRMVLDDRKCTLILWEVSFSWRLFDLPRVNNPVGSTIYP